MDLGSGAMGFDWNNTAGGQRHLELERRHLADVGVYQREPQSRRMPSISTAACSN